jgi:hypothetical protein
MCHELAETLGERAMSALSDGCGAGRAELIMRKRWRRYEYSEAKHNFGE